VDDPGMPRHTMWGNEFFFDLLDFYYVDMKSSKYRMVHRELEREWKANALP
jgi:hypothetical protein